MFYVPHRQEIGIHGFFIFINDPQKLPKTLILDSSNLKSQCLLMKWLSLDLWIMPVLSNPLNTYHKYISFLDLPRI